MNLWCSSQASWAETWDLSCPHSDPVVSSLWFVPWSSDAANENICTQWDTHKCWVLIHLWLLWVYKGDKAHQLWYVVYWPAFATLWSPFLVGLFTFKVWKDWLLPNLCLLFIQGLFPKSSEIFTHLSFMESSLFFISHICRRLETNPGFIILETVLQVQRCSIMNPL